jgi:hypothetical protein
MRGKKKIIKRLRRNLLISKIVQPDAVLRKDFFYEHLLYKCSKVPENGGRVCSWSLNCKAAQKSDAQIVI